MSVSNGKITAPVSMSDIAKVLGTTQDFTRSENINPWAKFKPNRKSFALGSRPTDWWKGDDGWCGLTITDAKVSSTSDVSNIASKYTSNKRNGWKHAAPRKGIDASRMLDFDGYNHNVGAFVGGYTMPSQWAKDAGEISVAFMLTMDGGSNADYLTYKDLPFSNQYLGIALIGDNKIYRCTNSTTIDDSGFTVKFSPQFIDAGTYDVYPFFSNNPFPLGANDDSIYTANIYTVPNISKTTLVMAEESIVIAITCSYTMATKLSYRISVTNNGAAAKTFSSNEVRVRYSGKTWNDARLSDEVFVEGQPADFTVNAGATKAVEGNVTVSSFNLQQDSRFWISLHGGNYIRSKEVDKTIKPLPTA
jgi:hypothetical protein